MLPLAGLGALAGSSAGPAIAGSLLGAGVGAIENNNQPEDPNRPKRRKLKSMEEGFRQSTDRRRNALAMLAEAAFNWASQIR